MAAPRYVTTVPGGFQQVATNPLGGAGSAETVVSRNASGVIDISNFPAGLGADIVSVPASEALSAGAMVNLYSNAGATNARNADASVASGGKKVSGFVLAAVSASATAAVYRNGLNTSQTGLTPGADYYLAATPGGITATAPTTAGQTQQYVGTAITATSIDIQPAPFVGIA